MNKDYPTKVLKRLLILCWATLMVCFIIKIFGGNFFNIVCRDERFIAVCDFIQNTFLYYVMTFLTSALTHYLIWSLMFNRKLKRFEKVSLATIFVVTFLIQSLIYYLGYGQYVILMSLIRYICVPLILKCNWKRVFIVNVLDIIFQIISMITKNVKIIGFDENVVVALIFMIDYYIMLLICYFYNKIRNKKEN